MSVPEKGECAVEPLIQFFQNDPGGWNRALFRYPLQHFPVQFIKIEHAQILFLLLWIRQEVTVQPVKADALQIQYRLLGIFLVPNPAIIFSHISPICIPIIFAFPCLPNRTPHRHEMWFRVPE